MKTDIKVSLEAFNICKTLTAKYVAKIKVWDLLIRLHDIIFQIIRKQKPTASLNYSKEQYVNIIIISIDLCTYEQCSKN